MKNEPVEPTPENDSEFDPKLGGLRGFGSYAADTLFIYLYRQGVDPALAAGIVDQKVLAENSLVDPDLNT